MGETFCAGCAGELGFIEEEDVEAIEIDTVGTVSGDVGEEDLLVPHGEGSEVVLIVLNVEIPVLG